jgi:hypothetical protein
MRPFLRGTSQAPRAAECQLMNFTLRPRDATGAAQ